MPKRSKRKEEKKQKPDDSPLRIFPSNTPAEILVATSAGIEEGMDFQPHPEIRHEILVEMSKQIKPGVKFFPDPRTPQDTLVAMSAAIQEGVVFQPHPDTPHETLVAMSEVINPGVIFHPHVETPRPTLVAMIKVMKPGVYILKWTGEKVEISEIMSDQDRLDIVGAGHREESAEQEKPGEQSFFRGEHSETMISPSHR